MRLSEMQFDGGMPIEGYGPGFFRVGGEVFRGGVLVTAEAVRGWGGYADEAALLALAGEVDVVLIGTGAQTAHVPAALRERLEAAGIGVEPMNSPAACRSYNVLLAEGRRVAAALMPV